MSHALGGIAEPEKTIATGFRSFYEREFALVVALVITLTGDRWLAEDVTQEAFARAYRDWDHVGGMDRPGAWVRRVAHNLAVSRFRRLRSRAKAVSRLAGMRQPVVPPVEFDGSDEAFRRALARLPERQRHAVTLRYVLDLSVREIAREMDVAEGTVKSLLHRGRGRMSEILGIEEGGP